MSVGPWPYDTAYAMVDREDDLKVGVKSTAILFGSYDRLLIGIFHALTIALLVIAGHLGRRAGYCIMSVSLSPPGWPVTSRF